MFNIAMLGLGLIVLGLVVWCVKLERKIDKLDEKLGEVIDYSKMRLKGHDEIVLMLGKGLDLINDHFGLIVVDEPARQRLVERECLDSEEYNQDI